VNSVPEESQAPKQPPPVSPVAISRQDNLLSSTPQVSEVQQNADPTAMHDSSTTLHNIPGPGRDEAGNSTSISNSLPETPSGSHIPIDSLGILRAPTTCTGEQELAAHSDQPEKPRGGPANIQENSSSDTTGQGDTSDLMATAMKALGYSEETLRRETTSLSPPLVQPTPTSGKPDAIRQTSQPSPALDGLNKRQENTARHSDKIDAHRNFAHYLRNIKSFPPLYHIHSPNRVQDVGEGSEERQNSASSVPPLPASTSHSPGVPEWLTGSYWKPILEPVSPTTHNLPPLGATPHSAASSSSTVETHHRGIALYPDPTIQAPEPAAIQTPVRDMAHQATAGKTMHGPVQSIQSAQGVPLTAWATTSYQYGLAHSTGMQRGTNWRTVHPASGTPADQYGNAHLNSDVPKD
jgi:hypothetical protein